MIIQQSETIWRFCKRIIFGDFYSQSRLLPVPPVYIISCLSHPSHCGCPRVRQPALNGLLWANFGSINTNLDLGLPWGMSESQRPGWEGGGLESTLTEWKYPHSTTPLQLARVRSQYGLQLSFIIIFYLKDITCKITFSFVLFCFFTQMGICLQLSCHVQTEIRHSVNKIGIIINV